MSKEREIRDSMTSEQILLERKLTCEAINGAMAFGYQNTNPPPSDDHWLAPFWKIGRKQAELESAAPVARTGNAVAWIRFEQLDVNSDSQGLPEKLVPFTNVCAGSVKPYGDGWKPLGLIAEPYLSVPADQEARTGDAEACDTRIRKWRDAFEAMHQRAMKAERALAASPLASHNERDAVLLDWLDATNAPFKMGWRVAIAPSGNVSVGTVIQLGTKITSIREALAAAKEKS